MVPDPFDTALRPMLARRQEQLPHGRSGEWLYEIKLDGVRAVTRRRAGQVAIHSRQGNPLTGHFPELVAAALGQLPERCVVDGEIVVTDHDGTSFRAVMTRLGVSAARAEALARQRPALLVVFDLLALGERSLLGESFAARRDLLVSVLGPATRHLAASLGVEPSPLAPPSPIQLMPQTPDRDLAGRWFSGLAAAGVEGIVAKRASEPYRPGRRAMVKVKRPLAGGR